MFLEKETLTRLVLVKSRKERVDREGLRYRSLVVKGVGEGRETRGRSL